MEKKLKSEIIINAAIHETRIAILEDDKLVEMWVERPDNERMVGDIYKGRIKAVIPGIQASFVDIGMEKSAFLHVSDVGESPIDFGVQFDDEDEDEDSGRGKGGRGSSRHHRGRKNDRKTPPIETLLTKEQDILVQVTKEPISTKGARLTSQITLPGRFLVLMPGSNKIGVSRKIASWNERRRLRQIAMKNRPKGIGVIIRTVAEGKDDEIIASEIKDLCSTYEKLTKKADNSTAPALIKKAMGMTSGIIRDLLSEDVSQVVVDSTVHYEDISRYLQNISPNLKKKVSLYSGKEPIFDHYNLEREIDSIFSRKVWLNSGAFLVFDHTEALRVIDVNTGRYTGKSNQEETILKINLESSREIARQLRLRDIGGIIVIDFIDMMNHDHRKLVEDTFAQALRNDRSKISISQISEFGLMEMTRQRVRPSLMHTFSETCPTCDGIGMVQGRDTTVTKVERWLARAEVFGRERAYTLFVHPAVFEFLIENDEERLTMLRSSTEITIEIVADSKIRIEEFHMFSTAGGKDITEEFEPEFRKKRQQKKESRPARVKSIGPVKEKNGSDAPPRPIPVAPEPVAPEPVAPEPVAPEPVEPEPIEPEKNGSEARYGRKPKPRMRR